MIGLVLSLLGVGGAVGAALYFFGPVVLLAFVKRVPWWVWAALIIVALLTLGYCHAEKSGEKKGAAKVEVKHARAHEKIVKARDRDEKAAQVTTDRIGASVARADQQSADLLKLTIEDLHNEIDAAKRATPPGAGPVVIDTAKLSAHLERGIGSANRSADAADAQP